MSTRRTHKQRAIDVLQAYGWEVADVEGWIIIPGQRPLRKDMWGLFDLLAINSREPLTTLALQVTSAASRSGHVSKHVTKMLKKPATLKHCLLAGWRCELWGIRDEPTQDGSPMLARTFYLHADGSLAVRDGSALFPQWG